MSSIGITFGLGVLVIWLTGGRFATIECRLLAESRTRPGAVTFRPQEIQTLSVSDGRQ